MTEPTDALIREVAPASAELGDYVDEVVSIVRALSGELGSLATGSEEGTLDERCLEPIDGTIAAMLAGADVLVGLGYAADRGVVDSRDNYLLWHQKSSSGTRRLVLNLDDRDVDFYDYHHTAWFSGARESGMPSVYGPYLDYAGADRLVHTVAVPIVTGHGFMGVAGADLDVADVERRVGSILARVGRPSVVMTRDRTVVAESGTSWMPGERLPARLSAATGDRAVVSIGGWTDWRLVVGRVNRD